MLTASDQIERFVKSGHRCLRIVTSEESDALSDVVVAAVNLGYGVQVWSAVHGVYDGLVAGNQPTANTENPAAGMYQMMRVRSASLLVLLDLTGHFANDERTLRAWRELVHRCEQNNCCVVLIDHRDAAPAVVDAHSVRVELPLPDEQGLDRIIRETLKRLHRTTPIKAAISNGDLHSIILNLRGLTRRQVERLITEAVIDDRQLSVADLPMIMEGKRRLIQTEGILDHQSSPETLEQIGGMNRLKTWLKKRSGSLSAEAVEAGLTPPRGILLLGVQGAGKSLCAKAVATAFKRPLLRMDVGALYDRYVGESERRLRAALKQAEMMAPIVLWIDEIEKAFASAASQSSDGGLSRRMFGALLTWMQERTEPVFLVATANDIEALPPELLRKGRFDEIFFVDLPGPEARAEIFRIHLRKRRNDPGQFDLVQLVQESDGFSGAEIEQAIISAMHDTVSDKRGLDTAVIVNALRNSPPLSVTMAEKIGALREWAVGRCVPAE